MAKTAMSDERRTQGAKERAVYSGPNFRPNINANITPMTPVTAQPGKAPGRGYRLKTYAGPPAGHARRAAR